MEIFGVKELIASIQVDDKLPIRTPKEIIGEEDYKIIKDTFNIVAKYRTIDWMADIPVSELQADIIALQMNLITLSDKFCMMSTEKDAEADGLKIARSKVRLTLKKQKTDAEESGKQVKVTADDIKDASLALTEQLAQKYSDIHIASNFLKFVYYSVRDAVSLMDKALHRMYHFSSDSEKRQSLY